MKWGRSKKGKAEDASTWKKGWIQRNSVLQRLAALFRLKAFLNKELCFAGPQAR